MHRSLRTVAVAVTVTVTVAGCGGGSADGANGSGTEPQFGAEEFGLTNEELNTRIEQAEASTATCMTAAGFEYVPVDAATMRDAMQADGSLPNVSDEQFIAEFGFGITTVFTDQVRELGRGEQNTAIRDGLAPGDQVAYDRALLGDPANASLARALEDEDFSETGGCTRQAAATLFSNEELNGSYLNPGDVLIEEDPRTVVALADWSTCMRDAGFDYEHPDDIDADLTDRLGALLGDAPPDSLSGPAGADLTELQGEELAIAAVAVVCEEDHIIPAEAAIEEEIYGGTQG